MLYIKKAYDGASKLSDKLTNFILPYLEKAGKAIVSITASAGALLRKMDPVSNVIKSIGSSLHSL